MSLLSRLASKVDKLNSELVATEALGLILASPPAPASVTAAIRAVAPNLSARLRHTTQQAGDEGRPDIVGSNDRREVLHLEGKFWAGLTPTQARGRYLDRMRRQNARAGPQDQRIRALLFVVPPRRVRTLMDELVRRYELTGARSTGEWWSAQTAEPKRSFASLAESSRDHQSPAIIVSSIGWISRGESIVSG